jgi:glycosyltransferase involved in cell wall biosynthesis
MIKVGFKLFDFTRWHAGINYYKNLFAAINTLDAAKIEAVVLCGKKSTSTAFDGCVSDVVRSPVFDKWSFQYVTDKLEYKLMRRSSQLSELLKAKDIAAISHTDVTYRVRSARVINWIPDFQHVHLPQMFSAREIGRRNAVFSNLIRYCDTLILSSVDAQNDLVKFYPEALPKSRVLNFVAQPPSGMFSDVDAGPVFDKYQIDSKYFFLPNQFWKHKNHLVVFKAVELLKQRNKDVVVVCSGLMDDHRNADHVNMLVSFAKQNGLEENIKCLGLIPYDDLCCLLRHSIAVINPSLFEGWSTTVEECKSVGKSIILSRLPVHVEQAPVSGSYFDPHNFEELAAILWEKWGQSEGGPERELELSAKNSLRARTVKFAETYQDIVLQTLNH